MSFFEVSTIPYALLSMIGSFLAVWSSSAIYRNRPKSIVNGFGVLLSFAGLALSVTGIVLMFTRVHDPAGSLVNGLFGTAAMISLMAALAMAASAPVNLAKQKDHRRSVEAVSLSGADTEYLRGAFTDLFTRIAEAAGASLAEIPEDKLREASRSHRKKAAAQVFRRFLGNSAVTHFTGIDPMFQDHGISALVGPDAYRYRPDLSLVHGCLQDIQAGANRAVGLLRSTDPDARMTAVRELVAFARECETAAVPDGLPCYSPQIAYCLTYSLQVMDESTYGKVCHLAADRHIHLGLNVRICRESVDILRKGFEAGAANDNSGKDAASDGAAPPPPPPSERKSRFRRALPFLIVILFYLLIMFAVFWNNRVQSPEPGYYRVSGVTYCYHDRNWYMCDGDGWRPASPPAQMITLPLHHSAEFRPEWGGTSFPDNRRTPVGYYRFDGDLYYNAAADRGTWYKCGSAGWSSSSRPYTDSAGHIFDFDACFLGENYSPEWGGRDIFMEPGYYLVRRKNELYFCAPGNEWYLYKTYMSDSKVYRTVERRAWTRSSGFLPDIQAEYLGAEYLPEWGANEMSTATGYFLYEGRLYYRRLVRDYLGSSLFGTKPDYYTWYGCGDSGWRECECPVQVYSGFFVGTDYDQAWGFIPFQLNSSR